MRGEDERPALLAHRPARVREPVEGELVKRCLDRAAQQTTELDDIHAQVLPGAARETALLGIWEVQKGQRDIGQRHTAAARQCKRREIAEPTADAEGQRRRQPRQGRRHAADERYAERRRSRTSSTTIGISESRITITTRMWMWSLMLGTVWPRR